MIKKLPSLSFVLILIFLSALPFQVWNSIVFPAQNGKILFGGWAGLILLVCWMLQYLSRKKESVISFSSVDAGIAGYTLFMLIHAVFIKPVSIDKLYIIRMVSLIPVYLLIRIISQDKYRYLFLALMASALGQAVWGVLQYKGVLPSMHLLFSATGTFFNPGPYAGYMAVVTPFAFVLLLPTFSRRVFRLSTSNNSVLIPLIVLSFVTVIVTALVIAQSGSLKKVVDLQIIILIFCQEKLYNHDRKRDSIKRRSSVIIT